MPYSSKIDLPASIRDASQEETAYNVAWSALKNSYKKDKGDSWHEKDK